MNWSRTFRKWFYRVLFDRRVLRWWDRSPRRLSESLGRYGELLAERYLLRQGWIVLARNHRTRYSELDLVAVEDRTVVFVEVKTRAGHLSGNPAEAVDLEKQRRISRAAINYIRHHHLAPVRSRFDVVAIDLTDESKGVGLVHYRDAFESQVDGD